MNDPLPFPTGITKVLQAAAAYENERKVLMTLLDQAASTAKEAERLIDKLNTAMDFMEVLAGRIREQRDVIEDARVAGERAVKGLL